MLIVIAVLAVWCVVAIHRRSPRHVYVADDIALVIVDRTIAGTGPDGEAVNVRGTATDAIGRGEGGVCLAVHHRQPVRNRGPGAVPEIPAALHRQPHTPNRTPRGGAGSPGFVRTNPGHRAVTCTPVLLSR